MRYKFLLQVFEYNKCVFEHTGYYTNCHYAYRAGLHYAKRFPDRTLLLVSRV